MTATPLNCALSSLVETIARAVALRYGCTEDEANTIRCARSRSIHPVFASLRAGDGREVRRFTTIKDLDDFRTCRIEGPFFAKEVKRACDK